jgi:two-component sensor histidine kinase
LNHRINNEFASVIKLVAVGAVIGDNPEVKAALIDVVELLHWHADVHRALAMVETAEYLHGCGQIGSHEYTGDALRLEADRCWRLGLLVHELITNSARHASFDNQRGEIKIGLTRAGALVNCIVSDNGSGSAEVGPGRGLSVVE